jgi:hypothetical protein
LKRVYRVIALQRLRREFIVACVTQQRAASTLSSKTILLLRAFRGFCGLKFPALGKYATVFNNDENSNVSIIMLQSSESQ